MNEIKEKIEEKSTLYEELSGKYSVEMVVEIVQLYNLLELYDNYENIMSGISGFLEEHYRFKRELLLINNNEYKILRFIKNNYNILKNNWKYQNAFQIRINNNNNNNNKFILCVNNIYSIELCINNNDHDIINRTKQNYCVVTDNDEKYLCMEMILVDENNEIKIMNLNVEINIDDQTILLYVPLCVNDGDILQLNVYSNETILAENVTLQNFNGDLIASATQVHIPFHIPDDNNINDSEQILLDENNLNNITIGSVGLVYDSRMEAHDDDEWHPECSARIRRIFEYLERTNLVEYMKRIPAREASNDELECLHTPRYIDEVTNWVNVSREELDRIEQRLDSIYLNHSTPLCARLACGATIDIVSSVLNGELNHGIAAIRPPGHHAEIDHAMGFCIFDNVAVAAQLAVQKGKRILIVDWDVHHGNGIQHAFYNTSQVCYISLHRYDEQFFYPASPEGNNDFIGKGDGEGYNINIAWNTTHKEDTPGDIEYLFAFEKIVIPIVKEFNADLVLVSAGFDAALGDPLGGFRITPNGYAHMTKLLKKYGKNVVIVLEGGYNLDAISQSMAACASTLIGIEPMYNNIDISKIGRYAKRDVYNVHKQQEKYWKNLTMSKK